MKVHPRQANKWGTWNTCDLSIQDDTMTQQPRDDRDLYKLEIIKTYSRLSKSFDTIIRKILFDFNSEIISNIVESIQFNLFSFLVNPIKTFNLLSSG